MATRAELLDQLDLWADLLQGLDRPGVGVGVGDDEGDRLERADRAKATRPILELSATTMTWRERSIMAPLLCASTSWCVVHPARTSIPSTPTNTMSRLSKARLASANGPGQLVGVAPYRPRR